jgi:hypothetical protein
MAEASVTIKVSTTEFALIERSLRSLAAIHKEVVADMSVHASERQKAREVQAQALDLLAKLS